MSKTIKQKEAAEDREKQVQYEDEKISKEGLYVFVYFLNDYVWTNVLIKHDVLPSLKQQS